MSDDAIQESGASFRCSRCKNVFDLGPETGSDRHRETPFPTDAPPGEVQQEPELDFTFPATEQRLDRPHDQELGKNPAEPDDVIGDKTEESWSINAEVHHEQPFTIAPAVRTVADDKIVDARAALRQREPEAEDFADTRDAAANVLPLDTFRDQAASIGPYLTLFGLLVLLFAFTAAYQQVHPRAADELIGNIPLVGSSVLHNAHLKTGVLLKSLRGGYQTIQGNREVFVVSGEALNRNPARIRGVQIAGQLYDEAGKTIEQQVIWVGNAISAKIVRGMSAQDVVDLQRLQPLKSFDIPPGDAVPFTIVFFKPARAVKDFSCEVQSAESAN